MSKFSRNVAHSKAGVCNTNPLNGGHDMKTDFHLILLGERVYPRARCRANAKTQLYLRSGDLFNMNAGVTRK